MGLSVVTRLSTLVEAEVACGALRAAGFRAEIFDHAIGTMYWLHQTAFGGFRIMVPDAELGDAVSFLRQLQRDQPKLRRPSTKDNGLWTVAALGALLLLHPCLAWMVVATRKARRARRRIFGACAFAMFVVLAVCVIVIRRRLG